MKADAATGSNSTTPASGIATNQSAVYRHKIVGNSMPEAPELVSKTSQDGSEMSPEEGATPPVAHSRPADVGEPKKAHAVHAHTYAFKSPVSQQMLAAHSGTEVEADLRSEEVEGAGVREKAKGGASLREKCAAELRDLGHLCCLCIRCCTCCWPSPLGMGRGDP